MTDTIEHGRLQAAESLAEAIASFDFGTNTGSALGLAQITSPEELAQKYPDIVRQVFPTDQFGNIIAYRPAEGRQEELRTQLAEIEKRLNSQIIPTAVNERESVNYTQQVPVIIENTITLPAQGIVQGIKNKISEASTGEKLAGVGIGATILRLII